MRHRVSLAACVILFVFLQQPAWPADNQRVEVEFQPLAASVSRLVYAVDNEAPDVGSTEESLFDRVQRFADDGDGVDTLPVKPAKGERKGGSVTDRMAALREIQGR